jgi:hypothetical protein
MGKITMDLAAMFPQTFGDKDALRRAATAEQLQNAQLNAYTQNQQEKDVIRSNQVLPFEDFKIDVNGEQIPFKALPPEQKMQWAKQRQVDWELEQTRKFTKYQADMAKAEVELETNLQKKKDIQAYQASGNVKPGPDIFPGEMFGKSYAKQQKDIEQKIIETEQKRNVAGIQMQALKDTQMPQSYGMPSVAKPAPQQPATQQQAVQSQAQPSAQPQAQQSVPSYESRAKAYQGGAKAGDIVYIPGVGKVRLR